MTQGPAVAVIGAGIAGLAAAHDLRRAGYVPTVFEERDRVGGRIWTVRKGDFLMDLGTAVYLGSRRSSSNARRSGQFHAATSGTI